MSIFKVKHWWSNDEHQNDESSVGILNAGCLIVDKFITLSDSDCILLGIESLLKIYKPTIAQDASHCILETELDDTVLQIDTGKFVGGYTDRQIIVLHPQSYAIYNLKRKEGHTDAGEQNSLELLIKHTLTTKAAALTCGSFGNVKTRDLICIQGLDGSLSFFDQENFLFMCIFNDVIIPIPVYYIANCNSFVVIKSTWLLEIYSYQQLREFSELSIRQNKRNIPQWAYNAGEEITQIQVIQTSNNFSSIVALGERHLYCFQDNGLMKYIIKFNFIPISFYAYLVGWYYEPTARLLVMVSSEDSKLYIYENTSLLWLCDLLTPAICLNRCYLKELPGGLVTLSKNGTINVCYLGTEPDLNNHAPPIINEVFDPEQVQVELEKIENSLQNILGNNDADNNINVVEQIITIKADVSKPVQNLFQEFPQGDEALYLLMCPVIVMLTCEDPKMIQSIQITYECCLPFTCSESTICLDNINGTEIIETQVFLSSDCDISETRVNILFTIIDSTGKISVLSRKVLLPLSLYCSPIELVKENRYKLCIRSNHICIGFAKIFTDFTEEDLSKYGNDSNVTFQYRSTKKSVTLTSSNEQYFIGGDDFTVITAVLDHFLIRLSDHYKRMEVNDFRFEIVQDKESLKQIFLKFFKSIEIHAKERIALNSLNNTLNVLQSQFTLIQKKLLVQYGSLPPGNCDPLEFLMRDTHKRIIETANEIINYKKIVNRAGSTLITVGHLILYLLKQTKQDAFKIKLIKEMMSLNCLYEDYQEWEEAVTQAVTYTVNSIFKKSEKDREKLAPVTEQGVLSPINLKRCLKQLRMIFDNAFFESAEKIDDNLTRIEEFVQVL